MTRVLDDILLFACTAALVTGMVLAAATPTFQTGEREGLAANQTGEREGLADNGCRALFMFMRCGAPLSSHRQQHHAHNKI